MSWLLVACYMVNISCVYGAGLIFMFIILKSCVFCCLYRNFIMKNGIFGF